MDPPAHLSTSFAVRRPTFLSNLLSFLGLLGFWLVMSGYYDAIHIGYGVACTLLVMALFRKIRGHRFFPDDETVAHRIRYGRAFYYVGWLVWQIIVSGVYVAGVILRRDMPIEPSVVTFRADLPGPTARMILGNSITLTPGTLTVQIEEDRFVVHALTPGTFAGIVDDSMPRQVLRLFSSEDRPVISDVRITHSNVDLLRSNSNTAGHA